MVVTTLLFVFSWFIASGWNLVCKMKTLSVPTKIMCGDRTTLLGYYSRQFFVCSVWQLKWQNNYDTVKCRYWVIKLQSISFQTSIFTYNQTALLSQIVLLYQANKLIKHFFYLRRSSLINQKKKFGPWITMKSRSWYLERLSYCINCNWRKAQLWQDVT